MAIDWKKYLRSGIGFHFGRKAVISCMARNALFRGFRDRRFFLALFFESAAVQWAPQFVGALLYMAVGVSIGALTLLYIMIERGAVSRVASVFYLVPVSAAGASFFIFDERLDFQVLIGISIVALGVLMTNLKPLPRQALQQ